MVDIVSRPDVAPSFARALFNTSRVPLLLFDGDLRVLCATPSFCTTFGISEINAEGRNLGELGGGEWDLPQLRLLLENALVGEVESGDYEADLVRPGAEDRRLTLSAQCLVQEGTPDAWVLLAVSDVTDARRIAEANVALLLEKDGLLRERAVLLQEMQHRVANSLQIIASILSLKARAVGSEETRLHLRDAHDRVMAVAAVQQHLQYGLIDVEVGPYLTKLCSSLASSMIREERPLTIAVVADQAIVSSHQAVSLGLIVTELVINALKHAFPDDRDGSVIVSYQVQPLGWTLSVTDDGVGRPPPSPTARIGLGTSLIDAMARQLDARVVMSDATPGTRAAIVNVDGDKVEASVN